MKRLIRTLFPFSFFTIGVLIFGGTASLDVAAQKRERNSTKLEQISPSSPSDVPVFIEDFNYPSGTLLTANGSFAILKGTLHEKREVYLQPPDAPL